MEGLTTCKSRELLQESQLLRSRGLDSKKADHGFIKPKLKRLGGLARLADPLLDPNLRRSRHFDDFNRRNDFRM